MQPRAAQQLSVVQAVPCASIGFGPWGGAGCPRGRRGTVWCPLNPPPPPKDGWYRLCRCTVCSVGSPEAPPCLQGNAVLHHAGTSPRGGASPVGIAACTGQAMGQSKPPREAAPCTQTRGWGGMGMGGAGAAGGGEGWLCAMQSIPSSWVEDEEEEEDDGWEPWRIWGS